MAEILFPLSSSPGRSRLEGRGELVNALTEVLGEGTQANYARRPAPGLRFLVDTLAAGQCRGFLFINNVLLVVRGTDLVKVEQSGSDYTAADIGNMDGAGPVYFARNNKAPTPDIVAVSSEGAFTIDLTTGPTSYPDPDLDQPNSVTFQDGFFIFTLADGRLVASGINDTTINPLDFTTAQARPGGLHRGVSFGQQIYAFGPSSIEVYRNSAEPEGFPFTRVTVIPRGLLAADAISGFEDGWAASLIWVADDRSVYRLDSGYSPQKISEPDLDRALQSVTDLTTLHALVFTHPGHPSWAIIGPDFAWVYDLATAKWHQRKSYGEATKTWKARCSVRAWGEWIVGHASDGKLYRVDDKYREEGDDPLIIHLRSIPVQEFPQRINIIRADFNFVVGQGLVAGRQPIETDPVCRIRYSKDGGYTFSTWLTRKLGRTGEYKTRVHIDALGLTGTAGMIFDVEISDPVYVTLTSASVEAEARPR